jgi:hypothetical protein
VSQRKRTEVVYETEVGRVEVATPEVRTDEGDPLQPAVQDMRRQGDLG